MVHVLPELKEEECELDELPAGREATLEHSGAFVHLLQARVADFQQFVKSKVPTFLLTDVLKSSFLNKRKRVHFEEDEDGFKTVNEEQPARELRGELAPENVVRPGAFPTAMPSRGLPTGVNLLVAPVQRLQQEDEGRIKWKDGDLTVVPKTKKCKNMDEWERGFFRIMCEAPAEARDELVDFLAWAKTIAADYTFYHFSEFYEHLVRQVQQSTVGISLDGYDHVWAGPAKVVVLEATVVVATAVAEVEFQMLVTGTTRAIAGISLIAISDMCEVCAELMGM
ncbi:hypothetical protein CYMTET_52776 [Cymbomonas tetramitiformis]|uniref:Uncharacterized protein n=1 Tax=Cymbomonas tetramitiformis TaxID=36881 RepID=A0AAE0BJP4_9CHLO|nr:hypothetical protein CYMTET_52776 [Cymbomonas tetramitiformis]